MTNTFIYKNIAYFLEPQINGSFKVDFNELAFTIHRIIKNSNETNAKSLMTNNCQMTDKECHKHAKQIIDLFIKKVNQLQK